MFKHLFITLAVLIISTTLCPAPQAAPIADVSAEQEAIKVIGIDEPPMSYLDNDGILKGISIDTVNEIMRRLNISHDIPVYPWVRAKKMALTQPNIVTFTVDRNKDREDKFHWITPISRSRWAFLSMKNKGITITSFEDAKKYKGIGVQRGGVREAHLEKYDFTNVEPATTHRQNIIKLKAGRIQLVFADLGVFASECKQLGLSMGQFDIFTTHFESHSYIVMSKKGTPTSLVKQWQNTAKEVKEDGTFDRMCRQWTRTLAIQYELPSHCTTGESLNLFERMVFSQ
ncbi:MAG: substrate-binding periplasmic protein [Desulfovibrio sp.]